MKTIAFLITAALALAACNEPRVSQDKIDTKSVQRQQSQYAAAQPLPAFDWSLERDLVIQLYRVRNGEVATHSVWRSDFGTVEGDCPSMGYGVPYDTSLTNPWVGQEVQTAGQGANPAVAIGQPEPNGVYASTNTSATWVFCLGNAGQLEPVYVESKVTVYPGPVTVDYTQNLVVRSGDATVNVTPSRRAPQSSSVPN